MKNNKYKKIVVFPFNKSASSSDNE